MEAGTLPIEPSTPQPYLTGSLGALYVPGTCNSYIDQMECLKIQILYLIPLRSGDQEVYKEGPWNLFHSKQGQVIPRDTFKKHAFLEAR